MAVRMKIVDYASFLQAFIIEINIWKAKFMVGWLFQVSICWWYQESLDDFLHLAYNLAWMKILIEHLWQILIGPSG